MRRTWTRLRFGFRTSTRRRPPATPAGSGCSTPSRRPPGVSASRAQIGDVVTGRGVAIGGFAGSFPAIVADVTVNKKTGKITATHLYAAQDAGTTVNLASVENQMSGCLIQGCSRALLEEVRFTRERQTSLDWISYPILRFKEAPKVTTVVV